MGEISSVESFYLEKTYASCSKVQERVGEASTVFIVLVATTSLITFAEAGSKITVPFLGVKLDRWLAVEVLVVLTCIAMYRMVSLICYSRILRFKLAICLDKYDVSRMPMWSFMFPSDHLFHVGIIDRVSPKTKAFSKLFRWGYDIFGYIWPLVILARAGYEDGPSSVWFIALALSVGILLMSRVLYKCTPQDREAFSYADNLLAQTDAWRQSPPLYPTIVTSSEDRVEFLAQDWIESVEAERARRMWNSRIPT